MAQSVFQTFRMRRLAVCLLLVGALAPLADARDPYARGEKCFGPKVGYVTRNSSAAAGLVFEYSFSRHVRIAPQASIIFRHRNLDALMIDIDVHFPLPFAGDRMAVYPLVGVDFTSWNLHGLDSEANKDVSSHRNRFGGNAGFGYEFKCTPTLKLNVEARYTLMKTYPGALVSAGISYVF